MADYSAPLKNDRLIDRFDRELFALAFADQGDDWLTSLRASLAAGAGFSVGELLDQAATLLEPVAAELEAIRPSGFDPVAWAWNEEPPFFDFTQSAVSVPGVLAAQLATCELLEQRGLNLEDAIVVPGYSQGVLGAFYAQGRAEAADLLAVAQLIGAAVAATAQAVGLIRQGERTPMIAISNISRERLHEVIDHVCADIPEEIRPAIGLRNGRDNFTLVGRPNDNAVVVETLRVCGEDDAKAIQNKERGGTPFSPSFSPLLAQTAFHHPALAPAVEQTVIWARKIGIDESLAREAAEAVAIAPVDWPVEISHAIAAGATWILDVGPGCGVDALTRDIVTGRGVGTLAVGDVEGQTMLFDADLAPTVPADWSSYAPRLEIRDGRNRLANRFTELTGRSPMLLAGMTPTTVDPEIVAAAANAGHWAELAGGGQVTPEILEENLAKLTELLEPGVNAQFNTMFLNPYLWNMHFGDQKLVTKARQNGAPIDGVVISAGIPALDDAVALIHELRDVGFPWIAFKPGAVRHIQKALNVADAVPEIPVILHVEGGKAGGHHSWNDLDELLIASYGDIRARANTVLVVGGGIGLPEQAADYITGSWAEKYDLPAMPVDGVLLGTVAMATKEATTSPQVKRLLVEARGGLDWIGVGSAKNGIASGRSQMGADIHEIDNSFAKAGRLLDEVADDAEAVAARRSDIIEALDRTSKVYFGDLETMTYREWLNRYLELSGPTEDGWIDVSWRRRFVDMLDRARTRLSEESHDVATLTCELGLTDDAAAAVNGLAEACPAIDEALDSDDITWFLAACRTPGKPVNFVPTIDADVRRWWRSDSLWPAHDARYDADAVCIMPGPAAVSGITEVDEPIADLLNRFNEATIARLEDTDAPCGADNANVPEPMLATSR